jgi:UDP-N-acetylglucosamine--N-acetylmuramyl-(pentapeptide) pyrophosphoryl-undecaprenol N-acetylglucosamine transferase
MNTGNPVRQDLIDVSLKKNEAEQYFGKAENKQVLLILGGSLGARKINQLIESQLDNFKNQNIQVIWQCGKFYYEEYKKYKSENVQVMPFIDRIDYAYALADVILSRAGASSVSELALVGKPVIFIPSPNVAEDHQTKNAVSIVNKGGAVMIKESELAEFENIFNRLMTDKKQQESLGRAFKKLAKPNATKDIVDQIVALMH